MASPAESLMEFYLKYYPSICAHEHTCVGLAIESMKQLKTLEQDFPGITKAMMLLSCHQNIEDLKGYTMSGSQGPLIETVKDHVLVAIHVLVNGRPGVFFSDLGFHISRVVTVMVDRYYPHTGWFIQSDEPHCRKEYNYQFNLDNTNYVEWHERETRGDKLKECLSLMYVAKPYLSAVDVTEKRNLVWDMRRFLARDPKGRLTAGIYFHVKLKDQQFTMIFDSNTGKQRLKLRFDSFLGLQKIPDKVVSDVEECNKQLRLKDGELLSLLKRLATVLADEDYMTELLEINQKIEKLLAGQNTSIKNDRSGGREEVVRPLLIETKGVTEV